MGASAAGVENEMSRRATVFVGVTCGCTEPVSVWMPCGELIEFAPSSACPPIAVGS